MHEVPWLCADLVRGVCVSYVMFLFSCLWTHGVFKDEVSRTLVFIYHIPSLNSSNVANNFKSSHFTVASTYDASAIVKLIICNSTR